MTFDTKRKFGVEVEFISIHTQSSTVSKINAYLAEHPEAMTIKSLQETRDSLTTQGEYDAATEVADMLGEMQQKY